MKLIFSLLMLLVVSVPAMLGADGFYTSGTKLMDANGNEFVMRGCNYSWAWQRGHENTVIPAAKRIGCNAIRIQLATGQRWQRCSKSDLELLIKLCEENKLVAIFNTHDETGSNNYSDLENAANFWIEMKEVLNAHRKYVLVNISNEWYGDWNSSAWAEGYKKVIPKLRNAGILNTLVVDCAGYGQYPKSLFDCGKEVVAADSKSNLIFSMHFYQYAADTESKVKTNINNALNVGVPVIIGEFACEHEGQSIAWQTILDYTKEKEVGYLVWSWTGNGGGASACDMFGGYDDSNYKPNGTNTVKGRNGIKETARECSIFDPSAKPSDPGTNPPVNPGQTTSSTVIWEGNYNMTWEDFMKYNDENPQWKGAQMSAMKSGDKLEFHFSNLTGNADAPAQIQLASFGLDDNWTWTEIIKADNIPGSVYTYTVSGSRYGDYTDLQMLSQRGFAVKGQMCTLVKVVLVGQSSGGNEPVNPSDPTLSQNETIVARPNAEIADWDATYHIERTTLGSALTSADKVRLYVSAKPGAEVQVVYKLTDTDWNKYVDYAPLSGAIYDIPMSDQNLLLGVNHDGLYIKGHDFTVTHVSVIRGTQGAIQSVTTSAPASIDFNQPYEVYTLDGRSVSEPRAGQLYILRQGTAVMKYLKR